MTADQASPFDGCGGDMRMSHRDLRNDTRAVIDAGERDGDVVLTPRRHPIARIVAIEPDVDDLESAARQDRH